MNSDDEENAEWPGDDSRCKEYAAQVEKDRDFYKSEYQRARNALQYAFAAVNDGANRADLALHIVRYFDMELKEAGHE